MFYFLYTLDTSNRNMLQQIKLHLFNFKTKMFKMSTTNYNRWVVGSSSQSWSPNTRMCYYADVNVVFAATVFNNANQHINVYGDDVEVDYRGYEVSWPFSHMFVTIYTLFHKFFSTFFWNKISLLERRNKRKSVLEITKMYYFKI